jgi:hypothetical protein
MFLRNVDIYSQAHTVSGYPAVCRDVQGEAQNNVWGGGKIWKEKLRRNN